MAGILDGLTQPQAHAAALRGPVLVLAGAGTGKTRTLTAAVAHRIANDGIPAGRVLAVTFTNRAAAEMLDRIRAAIGDEAAPRWIGTFHGLGARQLRSEPEVAGLRPGFDILDADDTRRTVKRVMKAMNLTAGDDDSAWSRDPLKLVCTRISRWKDELVIPEQAPEEAERMIRQGLAGGPTVDPPSLRTAARVYIAYQRMLRDSNAADFGDLLLWPAHAMLHDVAYRARWAGRFDAIAADEYQDVNRAQYEWLRALSRRDVFVVGDDDQSVYGWRGADVTFIRQFQRDFPNAQVVRLEENFRSTGHILDAANAVIARDRGRLGKTLFTRRPAGDRVEIVRFRDPDDESSGLVEEIVRRRAHGLAWHDMAILYRGNALSRHFEEALVGARIPYTIIGDVGFYQRAEIKDALALLRLVATPDDRQSDEALRRVINTPPRGFGPKALAILEAEAVWRKAPLLQAIETAPLPPKARSGGLAFADAIRKVSRQPSATVADQLSLVLEATGYRAMLRDSRAESSEGRLENIQELIGLAGNFHAARDLLDHAALTTTGPDEETSGTVKMMTMHKGKGLEFSHVFLPAWENGVFPPNYGDITEERRLAHVALTRGMRRVTISYCAMRHGYATPSAFIEDIPEDARVIGWLDSRTSELRQNPRARLPRSQIPAREIVRQA